MKMEITERPDGLVAIALDRTPRHPRRREHRAQTDCSDRTARRSCSGRPQGRRVRGIVGDPYVHHARARARQTQARSCCTPLSRSCTTCSRPWRCSRSFLYIPTPAPQPRRPPPVLPERGAAVDRRAHSYSLHSFGARCRPSKPRSRSYAARSSRPVSRTGCVTRSSSRSRKSLRTSFAMLASRRRRRRHSRGRRSARRRPRADVRRRRRTVRSRARPDPIPARSLEEARIGGLGIMMVRRAARAIDYLRTPDERNRLIVTIALAESGESICQNARAPNR